MQKTCHPLNFRVKVRLPDTHLFPKRKGSDKLYPQLLTYLLEIIKYQTQIISFLMALVLGKSIKKYSNDEPVNKPYRKLQVDELPILVKPEKLDYQVLLSEYLTTNGKALKKVSRRKNSSTVPSTIHCPKCGAPSDYLYVNNGGKGQYLCKVCRCTFNKKNMYSKEVLYKCPHCLRALEKKKERKEFDVYKCVSKDCTYYLKKIQSMSKAEKTKYRKDPQAFKLHYIYRAFKVNFIPLSKQSLIQSKVDLSRLYVSPHTLGLVLTYHVNYGLSARKTAALMLDVHGLKLSHQTVLNYVNAVSVIMKPYVDYYPYELSDQFCGDETYIRVNGKWHYLFFFFDAVKKVILSYPVSPNRDTLTAIKALDEVLQKMKDVPKNLNFVVDGNPIYLLAQHFFAQHDINFNVTQVIGLTNEDEVSREYRPLKQIVERLNRTFKGNYRSTHGFGSEKGSVSFVTLFVTYFNFLRPHAALEGKVPVTVPELRTLPHMPARWTKLIELAQNYLREQHSA